MSDVRDYSVHDLIRFRIIRPRDRGLLRPINLEFSFFETPGQVEEPDLTLNISEFVPLQGDSHLIDHKYRIRPNYFCCSEKFGRARWRVEIIGFEQGEAIVNFNGHRLGKELLLYPDLLAQDVVLKPLLEYKLCVKGHLLIHAAAVCKDNRAYLLAGRGGARKTTLAMQLVRQLGFQLMSDDQAIVQGTRVLSFPKHVAQLRFKLERMHSEEYRLTDRLRMIGYLLRGQFDLQIPRSAPLRAVVLISRTNQRDVSVSQLSSGMAVERLVVNNMIDMNSLGTLSGLFLRYMQAYSFVFPNSGTAQHWDRLRDRLSSVLAGVPVFEMHVPQTFTPHVIEAFDRLACEVN